MEENPMPTMPDDQEQTITPKVETALYLTRGQVRYLAKNGRLYIGPPVAFFGDNTKTALVLAENTEVADSEMPISMSQVVELLSVGECQAGSCHLVITEYEQAWQTVG